jgi:hypothetical protein
MDVLQRRETLVMEVVVLRERISVGIGPTSSDRP